MKKITALILMFAASAAMAQNGPPPGGKGGQGGPGGQGGMGGPGGQGGRPHGPPQEFMDACKGKAVGAVVQVKTPRGDTMKATCQMIAVPEQRK